jgi:hypothetical protein
MPDELVLSEHLLAPEYFKSIVFSGYNPASLLKVIPQLMKDAFRIESPAFYEDVVRWDVSSDPITFYAEWRAIESKDVRTNTVGTIIIQGAQNKKDKIGTVTVWILGRLQTKLPNKNVLDKMLNKTYTWLFYNNVRRTYLDEGKRRINWLDTEIRRLFDIMERGEHYERNP